MSDKRNILVRSIVRASGNGIAVAKVSSKVFQSDEEAKLPHLACQQ